MNHQTLSFSRFLESVATLMLLTITFAFVYRQVCRPPAQPRSSVLSRRAAAPARRSPLTLAFPSIQPTGSAYFSEMNPVPEVSAERLIPDFKPIAKSRRKATHSRKGAHRKEARRIVFAKLPPLVAPHQEPAESAPIPVSMPAKPSTPSVLAEGGEGKLILTVRKKVFLDLNGANIGELRADLPLEMTLPGNRIVTLRFRNPELNVDFTKKLFIRRDAETRVSLPIARRSPYKL